jgi:hypothetical protein
VGRALAHPSRSVRPCSDAFPMQPCSRAPLGSVMQGAAVRSAASLRAPWRAAQRSPTHRQRARPGRALPGLPRRVHTHKLAPAPPLPLPYCRAPGLS